MAFQAIALLHRQPNTSCIRETLLKVVLLFVALLPFFAFREISRVIGAEPLRDLIFVRGRRGFTLQVQDATSDRTG